MRTKIRLKNKGKETRLKGRELYHMPEIIARFDKTVFPAVQPEKGICLAPVYFSKDGMHVDRAVDVRGSSGEPPMVLFLSINRSRLPEECRDAIMLPDRTQARALLVERTEPPRKILGYLLIPGMKVSRQRYINSFYFEPLLEEKDAQKSTQ